MRYMHTPRRNKRPPLGYIPWPSFVRRYRHELVALALMLAVIGLALGYVLLFGDTVPDPVASSWSEGPRGR